MNESILFRGKPKGHAGWVTGFYVHLVSPKKQSHRIYTGYAETDCDDLYPDWFEVEPATVGQYTGLEDKGGTPIFEGDIIRTEKYGKIVGHANVKGCETFCVVYHPAMFRLERKKPDRGFNLVDDGYSKMEIIGNIHDNPELMEGE